MRTALPAVLALTLAAGCSEAPVNPRTYEDPQLLHAAIENTTEAMMESVTSPPVAGRTYAYASIAAYEALRQAFPEYRSLAGQLNGLDSIPAPRGDEPYIPAVASVSAFLTVAEELVFAPERVAAHRDSLEQRLRDEGVPRKVLKRSMEHGALVGQRVLAWANGDNLKGARAAARLDVRPEPGRWVPTPPAYLAAVEPNWGTLRPMVLAAGNQFTPPPPDPFDLREGSSFQRQLEEVYRTGQTLTQEQRAIAAFWDCNPFVMELQGHMMTSSRKISPGGHWMGVTRIATQQAGADMMRTAEAYARVALTLSDGFISAWDEKYRSVRVRPETVIQQEVDPAWRPLLQTPPFPEYPSGHSVVSGAVSEVLTAMFGDNFGYLDNSQDSFGLPARRFASFRQAAEEAALSRLYGGIHYRDAIERGLEQGRAVGRTVIERVQTSPPRMAGTN